VTATGLDRIRAVVSNPQPDRIPSLVSGIIGDRPSQYAKTPPLWNAVYRELGWDAVSLPWDLEDDRLAPFLDAARGVSQIVGFSVTQPFKVRILPLLDDVDPLARDIGAVNTVVRTSDGRLAGYNTDGQGAIDALTAALPGFDRPFLSGLRGRRVLLIGAGGAARAVAFYVARGLAQDGQIRIVNRDAATARSLAESVCRAHGVGEGGGEDALARWIADADLVINATVKGQAGWRRRADGAAFCLEPYSALGSADPAVVPAGRPLDAAAARNWFAASSRDIAENNSTAANLISRLSPDAACFDLIYAPLETRFLADARLSGHPTLNGKWMNVAQAADAFARKVCPPELTRRGLESDEGYRRAFEIMARVW
jgi:shikimate 5-dehydrogenase